MRKGGGFSGGAVWVYRSEFGGISESEALINYYLGSRECASSRVSLSPSLSHSIPILILAAK